MKLRTVLISVVVSAALVGGAGYGAYYATQSRKSPIEVVPVANVSQGYWGMNDQQIIYGSITSQVAQTVQLNEEYGIDKIYVKAGDEVREGTPLFSYDMTLQELELEMQELELQTNELTMTRLEKELEKLKVTPTTASLERNWFTLTASAEENAGTLESTEGAGAPEGNTEPKETEALPETEGQDAIIQDETENPGTPAGPEEGTQEEDAGAQDGLEIDQVEKVGESTEGSELSTVEDSVLSFEGLVLELQLTFLTCGDELKADDVGEAIEQAVVYYRKNLADEELTEEEQEDGSVKEARSYVLKDSVKKVLNKEEIETLRKRCRTLDEYQVKYVEMLISEAEGLEGEALPAAVERIGKAYELLDTRQQESLEEPERIEELKALAEAVQTVPGETGDGTGETGEDGGSGETDPGETGEDSQTQDGADQTASDSGEETAQTPEGGTDISDPAGDEDADGVRRNTVTFDVSEGAITAVNGQDVTNSIAQAENGRIVFTVTPLGGYEITEVLVDGSIPARRNEESDDPDDYIVEGIQTNDTIIFVRTQPDPDALMTDDSAPAVISEDVPAEGEGQSGEPGQDGGEPGQNDGESQDGESGQNGGEDQSDAPAQSGGESESEETEKKEYTVTINPGNRTEKYEAGRLVPLQADLSDVTLVFMGWSVAPTAGQASQGAGQTEAQAFGEAGQAEAQTSAEAGQTEAPAQSVELNAEDISSGYASFLMPEFDVTATARYENSPEAIDSYVGTFLSSAEALLAENAEQAYMEQGKDYLTELESAIVFYQQWLSSSASEILDESDPTGGYEAKEPDLDTYQLLDNVAAYLTEQGKEFQVTQLTDRYRELCLRYARSLFAAIDPNAINKELLEKATDVYDRLGDSWRKKLEKQWKNEQADLAEQAGMPWQTNKKSKRIPPEGYLGIGDTLGVYSVLQLFQEFLSLPPDISEEERYDLLLDIWGRYQELSDAQRLAVSNDPLFVDTFRQYGLWEDEPETEFPDFDDFGGFDGDEPMYTAEELAQMIKDKEQEIKACSLDIRQSELDLKQKQRIVDEKVVKSTMDGTVISIGTEDGQSDEDYFVKVANEAGLFARGAMNELTLEKLSVGDTISGMLQTNGTRFTAVIKEISEYPDVNGQYMTYGQENTNASYYSFYALIDDTEDLEEGDAEIYLTGEAPGDTNAIYLENYFVRTESDGRNYVYKKGDDGKLTKQYVKTGNNTGWSLEIKDGLTFDDAIAFPYGKDVKEGAKTKDVDMLQDAFM